MTTFSANRINTARRWQTNVTLHALKPDDYYLSLFRSNNNTVMYIACIFALIRPTERKTNYSVLLWVEATLHLVFL